MSVGLSDVCPLNAALIGALTGCLSNLWVASTVSDTCSLGWTARDSSLGLSSMHLPDRQNFSASRAASAR